jgi:hypothetical protein
MRRTLLGALLAILVPAATAAAALTHTASPPPNAAGWNNTPVTITWTAEPPHADPTPPSTVVSAEGLSTPQSTACIPLTLDCVTDTATVRIDNTAPAIVITRPTGTYQYAVQPVTAIYDCEDGLSGMDPGKGPGTPCAGEVASSAPLPVHPGGTDHTFTVTATDRAGNVFTKISSYRIAPSPPELVEPANGVTTNDRTPEFRWNNSVGSSIARYELYVDNRKVAQVPETACSGAVCQTAVTSPDLGPPFAPLKTPLDWYIKAVGVDGPTKDSAHRTVTIDPTVPNAPTLTGGPVGVTGDASPTFSWNGAGPHFKWQVVGADDQVVRGPTATTDVQAQVLPALAPGSYKFEVRQAGPNLVFGAAAVAAFTVDAAAPPTSASIGGGSSAAPPPAPSTLPAVLTKKTTKKGKSVLTPRTINARLLRPKAGAKIRDVTPTLQWMRRPKGAKVFNVQVFQGTKKILSRFPTSQRFTVPKGVLKRGKRYIWRVWPYFGPKRGYPKAPLGMSYLDVLKVTPRAKR